MFLKECLWMQFMKSKAPVSDLSRAASAVAFMKHRDTFQMKTKQVITIPTLPREAQELIYK